MARCCVIAVVMNVLESGRWQTPELDFLDVGDGHRCPLLLVNSAGFGLHPVSQSPPSSQNTVSVARRDVLGDVCNGLPLHRWHNLLVYSSFPSIWIAVKKCFFPSQGRSVLCEAKWASPGGLACHSDGREAHSLLVLEVGRTLQRTHFIPRLGAL